MRIPSIIRFTFCLAIGVSAVWCSAQNASFNILKGGEVIGNIQATRKVSGDHTYYSMISNSEFSILWKNTVESTTVTEYDKDIMLSCGAHMRINGDMRDSSHMAMVDDQSRCYVHPKNYFIHTGTVEWTTARMYYEEPVGQLRIFVESVMGYCPMQATGKGTYKLNLPEGKVNHYTYVGGILQEILVVRSMFDLVFRRV